MLITAQCTYWPWEEFNHPLPSLPPFLLQEEGRVWASVLRNWLGHTGLFSFHCLLCGGSNCPWACLGAKSPLLLVFASVIIIIVEGMQSWFSSPLAHLCFVKGLTFKRAGGSWRLGKDLGLHWPPFFPQRHDWLGKQRVAHILKFKKVLKINSSASYEMAFIL